MSLVRDGINRQNRKKKAKVTVETINGEDKSTNEPF